MAIKDWELVGRKLGMNHDITEYYNEKTGYFITFRKGWNNVTVQNEWRNNIIVRRFLTETAKIKFVKSYRMTH